MKKNMKKILALALSLLLLVSSAVLVYAAMDKTLEGQKALPVSQISIPAVQDGVITGTEYGTKTPVIRLTEGDGLWFESTKNDAVAPEFVDLYLARDGEALYAGIVVREDAHSGNVYGLSTFLGFGEDTNAFTMNSGATTTFAMTPCTRSSCASYLDMQPKSLSAKTVSENGTESAATRRFSVGTADGFRYPLPHWGAVAEGADGLSYTTYEVELDFHDSIAGSGAWDKTLPEKGYFGFSLDVYNGGTKVGVLHGNANVTGTADDPDGNADTKNTAPHVLLMNEEPDESLANANLSSLSFEEGALIETFSPSTLSYKAEIPVGTTSVTVKAKADSTKAEVEVIGADDLSAENNTVKVRVTAPNGYYKTYVIEFLFTSTVSEYWVDSVSGSNSGDGSESAPFATLQKALQTAEKLAWGADAALNIHLKGEATSELGILFGQKTIFNTKSTKLPITIDGGNEATITVNKGGAETGSVAAANDYTFKNLTMPLEGEGINFFAGSGKVRFDNVKLDEDGTFNTKATPFLRGDTFTAKVFEGWNDEQIAAVKKQGKGYVETSITLGTGTNLGAATEGSGCVATAVSDRDGWENAGVTSLRSTDTVVSVILDGAVVPRIAASYYGNCNETHLARAVMYSGDINILSADGNNDVVCTMTSPISLEMYGGTATRGVSMIRGGYNDIFNKDLTIIMEGGESKYVQAMFYNCVAKGNVTVKIGGTAKVTEYVYGSIGSTNGTANGGKSQTLGEAKNYVYGNANIKIFYGSSLSSNVAIDKIQNFVSGGTIGTFYGTGTSAGFTAGTVENTVTGGNITTYYGTKNATVGTVRNNISGGTIQTFKGTDRDSSANTTTAHVYNTISGGSFTSTFDGAYRVSGLQDITTNVTGGTFGASFLAVWGHTNRVGTVTTNVTGGTFGGSTFLGGYGGSSIDSITVNVSGDPIFNSSCNFGAGSQTWPSKVGSITATVTGGTFKGNTRSGAESIHVTGDIKTTITGGTFVQFFGGVYGAHSGKTVAASKGLSVDGKIITVVGTEGESTGPVFQGDFYGGHTGVESGGDYTVLDTGKTEVTVYGGTFEKNFYGGSDIATALTGDAETKIYGGTFKGDVVAGTGLAPVKSGTTQTLTLQPKQNITLLGAVASKAQSESITVVGDSAKILLGADASVTASAGEGTIRLEQTEEWKLQNYLTLPAGNTAKVKVTTAKDATGIWTTEEGTSGEILKVLGTDQPKTPAAKATSPTLDKKTYNSVSLVEEEGYEYSLDGVTWQESGKFEGLTLGQSYTFYRRLAETGKLAAGEASDGLSVTPEKEATEAPAAPALASKTYNTVILEEEDGYEYSIDGETWQKSGKFEGLKAETQYTFYRRLAETESHLASPASAGLSVTTNPPYITGDMDGSGSVDSDDAIYLLFYTLFEEDYPIGQPADFDGSGEVDSDDAIYLLFHTLFEEDYPL